MYIRWWILVFLLIPHFDLYYFQYPIIGEVISVLRILTLILVLPLLLKKITKYEVLIFFFFSIIIFSSVINQNLSLGALYRLVVLFGLVAFLLNQLKYNFKEIVTALYNLLTFLIILNFFTVLIGGFGHSDSNQLEFLLGRKNHLIFSTIPFLAIVYIYSMKTYSRLTLKNLILIVIGLMSVILAGSGTGAILSLLCLLFILIPKKLQPSIYIYIIINIVLFFSIVIYRMHEKWFSFIIVDLLEKSTTFSGRTLLWDISIEAIKNKFILGYGRGNTVISDVYWYLNETHNGFLQILLDSGLLGLSVFLIIIYITANRLYKFKNNKFSKVISFSIFLFLLNGLSESIFLIREFWLVLVLGYSIKYIINENFYNRKDLVVKKES